MSRPGAGLVDNTSCHEKKICCQQGTLATPKDIKSQGATAILFDQNLYIARQSGTLQKSRIARKA
jgi:hypothetical protein